MNLLLVFSIFFQFGLLCFGGGNVLTPIFIEELVESRHWLSHAEFGNLLAIAQITPGPISVNSATFFGFRYAGIPGAIAATVGLLTPSFLLVTFALRTLERNAQKRWVQGLMWGVGPATLALLFSAMKIFLEMSIFSSTAFRPSALILILVATLALWRKKISPTWLILLCACLGACLFPILEK